MSSWPWFDFGLSARRAFQNQAFMASQIFFIRIILAQNIGKTMSGEKDSPVEAQKYHWRARENCADGDEAACIPRRLVWKISAARRADHTDIFVQSGEPTAIRDYEAGAIAKALKVSVGWLYGET
jgi:hypothetical protein